MSSVNEKLVADPRLPAASTWRTCTALAPSTALKLELQVVPPSVEYCTLPPASDGVTVSAPLLVILSLPEEPVSLVSATVGAFGAAVSRTNVKLVAAPMFPAASIWRTWTVLVPSTATKLELQVVPPSIEYWTVPPFSAGVTVIKPLGLIPDDPVSSATFGAPGPAVSTASVPAGLRLAASASAALLPHASVMIAPLSTIELMARSRCPAP